MNFQELLKTVTRGIKEFKRGVDDLKQSETDAALAMLAADFTDDDDRVAITKDTADREAWYRLQQILLNHYWEAMTGENLDLEWEYQQSPYISPPLHVFMRDRFLQLLLVVRPVMLVVGAGMGMEAFVDWFLMNAEKIIALEPALPTQEGEQAYKKLTRNKAKMLKKFPQLKKIPFDARKQTAVEYFESVSPHHSHVTTLDPPFSSKGVDQFEDDLQTGVLWAIQEVVVPMFEKGFTTDIFCLKSRYPPARVAKEWKRIAEVNFQQKKHDYLRNMIFFDGTAACPYKTKVDYEAIKAGKATKGVFYWVMFSRPEARIQYLRNNVLWLKVIKEHNQDLYVRRADVLNPDLSFDYSRQFGNVPMHTSRLREDDIVIKAVPDTDGHIHKDKKVDNDFEMEQAVRQQAKHERNMDIRQDDEKGWKEVKPGRGTKT
jgi:hypothetical protein